MQNPDACHSLGIAYFGGDTEMIGDADLYKVRSEKWEEWRAEGKANKPIWKVLQLQICRPKFGLKNTSYDPNVVSDRNVKNSFRTVSWLLFGLSIFPSMPKHAFFLFGFVFSHVHKNVSKTRWKYRQIEHKPEIEHAGTWVQFLHFFMALTRPKFKFKFVLSVACFKDPPPNKKARCAMDFCVIFFLRTFLMHLATHCAGMRKTL